MRKQTVITQESFDQLLAWLGADRERAGEKYEHIRRCLIKIFASRGCTEAESLADETINRVTLKAERLAGEYVGDPALYFYGVAQKVYLESLRKSPAAEAAARAVTAPVVNPVEASEEEEDERQEMKCLVHCIQQLSPNHRELVVEYYQNDKRAKIDHRKQQAERLGIAQNALRIRAHRIRMILQQCMQKCLKQEAA
ncbi:MAG: sigma-70 family RNA polymerase sigma factor [Acidobacteria bacterium]|nr:sigma-70 family RNA polymerase sigma factor [Acidobacteriota bacterium]